MDPITTIPPAPRIPGHFEIDNNEQKRGPIVDFTSWETQIPRQFSISLNTTMFALIAKIMGWLLRLNNEQLGQGIAIRCAEGKLQPSILSYFSMETITSAIHHLQTTNRDAILPGLAHMTAALSEPTKETVKNLIKDIFFSKQKLIKSAPKKYTPLQFRIPLSLLLQVQWQFPDPSERKPHFHDQRSLRSSLNSEDLPAAIQAINYYMDDYLDIEATIHFLDTLNTVDQIDTVLEKLTLFKLLYLLERIENSAPLFIQIENLIIQKLHLQTEKLFIAYLLEHQNDPECGIRYCQILQRHSSR